MAFPSFVARSAQKLALGGAVVALAIWIAAEVVERTQLGADLAASRARLQAEVSGQFVGARPAGSMRRSRPSRSMPRRCGWPNKATPPPPAACSTWPRPASRTSADPVAITIYGARNQPVAWVGPIRRRAGRPADRTGVPLPRAEHARPAAGPRAAGRGSGRPGAPHRRRGRRGAAVARRPRRPWPAPTSRSRPASSRSRCGCQFEGAADAGPDAFIIRTPAGEPLAAVQLSDADLTAARQRIRDRRFAGRTRRWRPSCCCCSPERCSTGGARRDRCRWRRA